MDINRLIESLFESAKQKTTRTNRNKIEPIIIEIDASDLFDKARSPFGKRSGYGNVDAMMLEQLATLAYLAVRSNDRTPHYMWSDGIINEVANLSCDLVKQNPRTRFFGVGNSPSYIIYGIESLSPKLDAPVVTGYIPFSGRYLYASDSHTTDKAIVYDIERRSPDYIAAQANQASYRKLLESLGLHPSKIIEDFRQTGQRTAIIDNIQSGGSFVSFIHFMNEWAKDLGYDTKTFSRTMRYIGLSDEPIPSRASIPEAKLDLAIQTRLISENLRLALNGNMSMDTDRFVSHYSPQEWKRPPGQPDKTIAPLVDQIKQRIRKGIDAKFGNRPVLWLPRETKPSATP